MRRLVRRLVDVRHGTTAGAVIIAAGRGAITAEVFPFVGVDVVSLDSGIVLLDQTVVARNGRIEDVDLRSSVAVPAGAERIDGSGLFIMPGLLEEDLPADLASGITTVRNMWATTRFAVCGNASMDPTMIPQAVAWTWEAGAYVCPTLAVVKELTRQNSSAENATIVAETGGCWWTPCIAAMSPSC